MKVPYENSYLLACDKLAGLNLEDVAFNSSSKLEGTTLYLDLINESFAVAEAGKNISLPSSNREVKISEKILLLHYLTTSDGFPLQREDATLENIPGAAFYYATYKARTINQIASRFNSSSNEFTEAAKSIGFKITEETSQYCRLKSLVLPNVPISFVLWKNITDVPLTQTESKYEFESLKILYDASITHYLPLEDIIILTELVAYKIIKSADPASYLK